MTVDVETGLVQKQKQQVDIAIAIGERAGQNTQQQGAIAIGYLAGRFTQT